MNRRDSWHNPSGRKTATRMKRYNRHIMRRALRDDEETTLRCVKSMGKF